MARRKERRFLPIALLLLLAAPTVAAAADLKLWPLVDLESGGGGSRLSLLGPLVEWRRDPETTSFTLRPLLTLSRDRDAGRTQGSLLYPVAWWRHEPGEFFLRFFGLVSYERSEKAAEPSPWTRELTVFPFVFYRRGSAGTSLSVIPLYADLPRFFGYERVQMLLFPLYLRLVEPLQERRWLPFPFFSRVGGRLGRGLRLWPVYGKTVVGFRSETTYVGWPFYIRHVDHPGGRNAVTTRISWPLFSVVDGPKLESRTWGYLLVLPLYTRTIDRRSQTESRGFPWPFWVTERTLDTGELRSVRLTPLYQDRRTETLRSVFYGWPFYRFREGLGDAAGYRRTDVLFVLYRDQHEGHGRDRLHTRALLPLWISRKRPDASRAQAFTLLDGLFPKNATIEALYAPLYRIYGNARDDRGTRHDVLWRMWEWGGGRFRPPLYVSAD